jgi:hypothetical protein
MNASLPNAIPSIVSSLPEEEEEEEKSIQKANPLT